MAAKEISVKKYVVRLSGEERERLETLIRTQLQGRAQLGNSLLSVQRADGLVIVKRSSCNCGLLLGCSA